jgi:hypothetical protein
MEGDVLNAYRDLSNPGAYSGLHNFYKINKFAGKKRIQRELFKSKGYRLHFPSNKRIKRRQVYVPGINNQFGMDLIDIERFSKSNYNKHYILAVVCYFSKMAWMEPIKRKTCVEVRDALEKILNRAGVKPSHIQHDKGKEFEGKCMKDWTAANNIKQFTTSSPMKVSYVERFNRTIMQRISRYMTEKNTKRFVHKLRDFELAYQNSVHRAIGRTPASVNRQNESEVWDRLYGKRSKASKGKLKVHSKVNIKIKKGAFVKGYAPNFEEKVHEVVKIIKTNPITYQLKDNEGTILERKFYGRELVSLG